MNSASDILNLQYPQNMEYIKDIWDLSICKRSNITRHLNFFTSLLATRYRIVSPLSPRYWKERLNSHKSEIKRKKSSWSAGDPIKRRPATTPQCWLFPHDVSQMFPCHLDRAWEERMFYSLSLRQEHVMSLRPGLRGCVTPCHLDRDMLWNTGWRNWWQDKGNEQDTYNLQRQDRYKTEGNIPINCVKEIL